jgi:hypothetical protein
MVGFNERMRIERRIKKIGTSLTAIQKNLENVQKMTVLVDSNSLAIHVHNFEQ